MLIAKFIPTFSLVLPHRSGFGVAQNLRIFWLLLVTLVFLAGTTLPNPEIKTLTLAYEPHPDSCLAVVTRNLTENLADGNSGFFKLFRNDDAMRWRLLLVDMAEETLDDKDRLFWKAGDTTVRREPARSFWQRFQSGFFGLFDLDDQL